MKLSEIKTILNDPDAIPDEWPDTIVCQLCNALDEIQEAIRQILAKLEEE